MLVNPFTNRNVSVVGFDISSFEFCELPQETGFTECSPVLVLRSNIALIHRRIVFYKTLCETLQAPERVLPTVESLGGRAMGTSLQAHGRKSALRGVLALPKGADSMSEHGWDLSLLREWLP